MAIAKPNSLNLSRKPRVAFKGVFRIINQPAIFFLTSAVFRGCVFDITGDGHRMSQKQKCWTTVNILSICEQVNSFQKLEVF